MRSLLNPRSALTYWLKAAVYGGTIAAMLGSKSGRSAIPDSLSPVKRESIRPTFFRSAASSSRQKCWISIRSSARSIHPASSPV